MAQINKGKGNPHWKGGLTHPSRRLRGTSLYKKWRSEILRRDNYTCVLCGLNENLEADHIKNFHFYKQLRFDLSNGRTLCHGCHIKTDDYAYKSWYGNV